MTPDDNKPDQDNSANGDQAVKRRGPAFYRKARRKARKLGLTPENDAHAAQLLEELGIDILNDDVTLLDGGDDGDLVLKNETSRSIGETSAANITLNDAERLAEVHAIQRELVRRRRVRLVLLMLRLALFVFLPTFAVGWFYSTQATDLYETNAEFIIQKSESVGALGLGSLLAGTGFANSADSIVVQGYLTSREAMERLDKEEGYRAHFEQETIDNLHRLTQNASFEAAYKLYRKFVKVGFDPTEGVIHMQVIAADPKTSQRFAEALIKYAEERIDNSTRRMRDDQMSGSQDVYKQAQQARLDAQQKVLDLQQRRGMMSADAEIASQMTIINALEMQIEAKRLSLSSLMDNSLPNQVRVDTLQKEIERTQQRVDELRSQLTANGDNSLSLASISAELTVAQGSLATRATMEQQALLQVEAARIEVNRQVRYLSVGVSPIAPDVPTYPRKVENTILAFIIFMAIYLVLSLTVSILREQVSV